MLMEVPPTRATTEEAVFVCLNSLRMTRLRNLLVTQNRRWNAIFLFGRIVVLYPRDTFFFIEFHLKFFSRNEVGEV